MKKPITSNPYASNSYASISYLAYSTALDSRITVTFIWPG